MRPSHIPGRTWLLVAGGVRRTLRLLIRPLFATCGRNVRFNPFDPFSYRTIRIGDDVFIAGGACFSVSKGLTIGNKVMFGPNVTIRGGNHNTSVLGNYMADVQQKRPQDDLPIAIEDDVWIGAGAIILKGVTIGRGAIVAAGAVVTHSIEPYSIVAGVPARRVRFRWAVEDILEHEKTIYPPEKRISQEQLQQGREEFSVIGPIALPDRE